MGVRFFRRFRLFPGVRLNVSRSGVSASVGVPGAHVTIGRSGVLTSASLPGTGLGVNKLYGWRRAIGGIPTVTHRPVDWTLLTVTVIVVVVATVIGALA